MSRYAVTLSPDVRDVLERSVITATALTLPGQLDRGLYERVMKVIAAAGGKWNRKAQAHLFPHDPREALGLALETGSIVDQKKALNQFFTPPDLAVYVVQAATVVPGMTVLEPSAGAGALAEAARAAGGDVQCVEVDPVLVEALRAKGFPTRQMNFLHTSVTPIHGSGIGLYDAIVMNPPFTVGADVEHITHALQFLKPGGKLAAIASAGVTFRQDKATRDFRAMVKRCKGHTEPLPDDSFVEAGTKVRTVLVTLRKPYEL